MAEFRFDPPLMLHSNVVVSTLEEATAFLRSFHGARRPLIQQSVLSRVERAGASDECRVAAQCFRGWARMEGLLAEA